MTIAIVNDNAADFGAYGPRAVDMAQIALEHDVDDMWLYPGSTIAASAKSPDFWEGRLGWKVWRPGDRGAYATIRRDDGSYAREVVIHGDTTAWESSPESPQALRATIDAYERALGTQCYASPGSTALRLLKQLNDAQPARAGWLRPMAEQWVKRIAWPVPPDPQHVAPAGARLYPYVHVLDKNAAHMAAATSRNFGSGDPIRVTGDKYDDKSYGYWQVSGHAGASKWNGKDLPDPFGAGTSSISKRLVYGPQIKSARALGWNVEVHSGLLWNETHDLFDFWVKAIWSGRMQARSAGSKAAEQWIKRSFNAAKGTFSHIPEERDVIRWSHRPDWGGTIVAEHGMRQLHQIRQFIHAIGDSGRYLAVKTDQIFFASQHASIEQAIPGIKIGNGIGQYKQVATYAGAVAHAMQAAHTCQAMQAIMDEV